MSQPALRLVDPETGELHGTCPTCGELKIQLEGAEREIRAWRSRYNALRQDSEDAAKESPYWPDAMRLFALWKRECKHPRSVWTIDRFRAVEPLIRKYGLAVCERAIAGAAFDPYITTRRNGTKERHDDFGLIFRDAGKLERFANKAPAGFEPQLAED